MDDLAPFSRVEILGLTGIGESESLGIAGMTETICTVMNRAKANLHWLGGNDVRNVCLAHDQYSCWNEGSGGERERLINIATQNPLYGPYVIAIGVASRALANDLPDVTNDGVSYFDSDQCNPPD